MESKTKDVGFQKPKCVLVTLFAVILMSAMLTGCGGGSNNADSGTPTAQTPPNVANPTPTPTPMPTPSPEPEPTLQETTESEECAGHNLEGLWYRADREHYRFIEFSGTDFRILRGAAVNDNLAAGTFTATEDSLSFEQTVEFPWYRTTSTQVGEFERVDEDTILINRGRYRRVTDPERIAYFEERWNIATGTQ